MLVTLSWTWLHSDDVFRTQYHRGDMSHERIVANIGAHAFLWPYSLCLVGRAVSGKRGHDSTFRLASMKLCFMRYLLEVEC